MKLNIGCGPDYREGFVNIDSRPEIQRYDGVTIRPDMVVDITQNEGRLYPANTIERILARDILEHFGKNVAAKLLVAWAEMLEPRGILELQFPDIEASIELARSGKWSWDNAIGRIYGGQDHKHNIHYWAYTPETITEALRKVGLSITEIKKVNCNLKVFAVKG